jgi:hypothetical protein
MPHYRGSGTRARRAILVAAAIGFVLSVLSVGVVASGASPTPLREGVYAGAADPGGIAAFDSATGTHSTIAADYLPSTGGWSAMDGAGNSLKWLFADGWTGTPYTLLLGVPIIPTDSAGHPVGTLAAGATGAYNAYFVTLAQTLVAAGESNAYLRLGWEFDGDWTAWKATSPASETNFAAYFRQIVRAMRSVPGEKFRFVWNPDADAFTQGGYNVALAYPGNPYVSVIGLDVYDQSWVTPLTAANAWNETTLPSLTSAEQFATVRGKPLAMNEWGTAIRHDGHGLGDDPLYVTNMIGWMRDPANHVTIEAYFNYDGRGTNSVITGGDFPESLHAFRAAFKRTNAGVSHPGDTGFVPAALVALVFAFLVGLAWVRRVRRNRRPGPTSRRVYPPLPEVALPPRREWAEQSR